MAKKIRRARKPTEPTAGKLVIALSMLRRKKGVTVPQLASAIDWQTPAPGPLSPGSVSSDSRL